MLSLGLSTFPWFSHIVSRAAQVKQIILKFIPETSSVHAGVALQKLHSYFSFHKQSMTENDLEEESFTVLLSHVSTVLHLFPA